MNHKSTIQSSLTKDNELQGLADNSCGPYSEKESIFSKYSLSKYSGAWWEMGREWVYSNHYCVDFSKGWERWVTWLFQELWHSNQMWIKSYSFMLIIQQQCKNGGFKLCRLFSQWIIFCPYWISLLGQSLATRIFNYKMNTCFVQNSLIN